MYVCQFHLRLVAESLQGTGRTPMRRLSPGRLLRRLTVAWRGASLARQTFIAFYSFTVGVTAITFMLYVQDTRNSVLDMERSTMTSMFPLVERVITNSMLSGSHDAIAKLFAVHNSHGKPDRMFLLDADKQSVSNGGPRRRREASPRGAPGLRSGQKYHHGLSIQNRGACVRCHGPEAGADRVRPPRLAETRPSGHSRGQPSRAGSSSSSPRFSSSDCGPSWSCAASSTSPWDASSRP